MVDVRYCALDEQGLTSMLRALRANCMLRTLHLEGNNLTGKGVFILSESVCTTLLLNHTNAVVCKHSGNHALLNCSS